MPNLAELADPVRRAAFIERMFDEDRQADREREIARFRPTHTRRDGGLGAMVETQASNPDDGHKVVVYIDGAGGPRRALDKAEFDHRYVPVEVETTEQRLARIDATGCVRDNADLHALICGRPPLEMDAEGEASMAECWEEMLT